MVRVAGLEPARLSTTASETVASAYSAIPAVCLLAVRVGFEPTVHGVHSGFRDRRLNPLGHLTVLCGTWGVYHTSKKRRPASWHRIHQIGEGCEYAPGAVCRKQEITLKMLPSSRPASDGRSGWDCCLAGRGGFEPPDRFRSSV